MALNAKTLLVILLSAVSLRRKIVIGSMRDGSSLAKDLRRQMGRRKIIKIELASGVFD